MRPVSCHVGTVLAPPASPLAGTGRETEKKRWTSWSGAPPVPLPPGGFASLLCVPRSLGLKWGCGEGRAKAQGWPEVSLGCEDCPSHCPSLPSPPRELSPMDL